MSFEGLLSLRLSDHFALVVGCINNNWLNPCTYTLGYHSNFFCTKVGGGGGGGESKLIFRESGFKKNFENYGRPLMPFPRFCFFSGFSVASVRPNVCAESRCIVEAAYHVRDADDHHGGEYSCIANEQHFFINLKPSESRAKVTVMGKFTTHNKKEGTFEMLPLILKA